MNKYNELLEKILETGKIQKNKKGNIVYLINQTLSMSLCDVDTILMERNVAVGKLRRELDLYLEGEEDVQEYQKAGIRWWDYCAPKLKNTYPKYFKKLPALIRKINKEKRPSKNYVLFIGETGADTCQLPCLSLIQFQINDGELYISVYQRSADANLGLPSDIYHILLISRKIDVPLANITFFIGNVHIYENNIEASKQAIKGINTKFNLNV